MDEIVKKMAELICARHFAGTWEQNHDFHEYCFDVARDTIAVIKSHPDWIRIIMDVDKSA